MDSTQFNRSKIYEKLDYAPEPKGYSGTLPWVVQQQIAATNGIHYVDRVGKLKNYPAYELPVQPGKGGLMLDIGTGWGRWLVAGARKGFVPIGVDLRLEFCHVAMKTMKDHNVNGYSVVADLKELPFANEIFDLVWSFSVIQHTHQIRFESCLKHIHRILKGGGYTKLQFPNKEGLRNRFGPVKKSAASARNYDSWVVRYYGVKEYEAIFRTIFRGFSYSTHSFLGIGVLKEDLQYVSAKNKFLCAASLALSGITKVFPVLSRFSDSLYLEGRKEEMKDNREALRQFYIAHDANPDDNLNIVPLLQCPLSTQNLRISADRQWLITFDGKVRYPVVNNIPVLIISEAVLA